ncbi:MAG: FAD-dependent oxidoreductase, partial [Solobacterium sp.]|nr:FAD-dependent oxidoreductase [Solobacterium sp.]
MLQKVFTPMNIGTCTIKNRFAVPAMVTNYCDDDGMVTDRYIAYIAERAKGGFGLIITEDYAVTEHGKGYARIPGLWKDEQIEGSKKLTDAAHEYGAKIFCQMYHPGKQSTLLSTGGVQPVAPSAIKDPLCQTLPREITIDEIHTLVKEFGEAALRAKKAGFDGIEVHAGHGYLIAQFLSPFINKRTDEYGGCFENRVRFLDEVYAEIRKNVGEDFPIQIRFSANEFVAGGRTEAESYQLAMHVEELGFNSINVSNGVYASDAIHQVIAPMAADHAFNMEAAMNIKKLVNIPVLVANRINNPNMAETLIAMGKTDFVCMGRGSIVDPELPNKAKEGRFDEINYCLGCLQGCGNSLFFKGYVDCLVNPNVGLEYQNNLNKAEKAKKVMIIGGGPAGLMAARTAAQKGHDVTLFEKDSHLGGAFRAATYPMGKGELSTVISSYRAQCQKLGVKILMNTEVTEETIKEFSPEAIIIATGSKPLMPPIKGIDSPNVVTGEDILYGVKEPLPGPVVVCGGGEVGGETAEFIAETSFFPVTILEMQKDILNDMAFQNKDGLLKMLANKHVNVITNAKVSEITENGVSYTDPNGATVTVPAATVVSAFGYKAYNPLQETAEKLCSEVYVVGSAVKAGNAMVASDILPPPSLKLRGGGFSVKNTSVSRLPELMGFPVPQG